MWSITFPLCFLLLINLVIDVPLFAMVLCFYILILFFSLFIPEFSFYYTFFYLDSISFFLVLLLLLISLLSIIASFYAILEFNHYLFINLILAINIIIVLSLLARNWITFYIFFEASLIPLGLIIFYFGYTPERILALNYIIIYTIFSSLFFLISIIWIKIYQSDLSLGIYPCLFNPRPDNNLHNNILYFFCAFPFIVKTPIFLFHQWLPKAHTEAPVAGSIILAGILLKLGSFGLLRLNTVAYCLPPNLNIFIVPLSLWGAFTITLVAFRQLDIKRLIAYASVSHISAITAVLLSIQNYRLMSVLLILIGHGVVSSGLFAWANIIYELTNTRNIILLKGSIIITHSIYTPLFFLLAINAAVPPSLNFFSEIFIYSVLLNYSIFTIIPLILISFFTILYSLSIFIFIIQGQHSSFLFSNLVNLTCRNLSLLYFHILVILFLTFSLFIIT